MRDAAAAADTASADVCFDGWHLRADCAELWLDGARVAIQEKPLKILEELVARPGELVSRQYLIGRLWPDRVVEFDTALNTAVKKLRAVLDDDPERPRYIETVPRKGYRFIGRVNAPSARESRVSLLADGAGLTPPRRRVALGVWSLAGSLAVAAIVLAFILLGGGAPEAPQGSALPAERPELQPPLSPSPAAFYLYLQAKDRISEIQPNQPELALDGLRPPRGQVLDLLDEALQLDPEFAHAYVLRARVHLDFFVANLDVSDVRLAAVRADLERARQVSQDPSLGRDVRGLYAAFVDVDVDRALRELGYGQEQTDQGILLNQARVLTSMGRSDDSDELLRRLLVTSPTDHLTLRMRASNFLAENRPEEMFHLVRRLAELNTVEIDTRSWTYLFTGIAARRDAAELARFVAGESSETTSERLFAASSDLMFLRHEQRYLDVQHVLAGSEAESVRFGSFIGASPGLGHRPVAELGGWNELLLGNRAAAAAHGTEVLAFVAAQRESETNGWVLAMLRATGLVLSGDDAEAVRAVEESLRAAPLLRQVEVHRTYLAATVLAWAGRHDEAVALLERVTAEAPSIGPVRIAREPLLTVPLRGNARFEQLVTRLDEEISANRELQLTLPPK
jgi:DNA-binding winged helix-turn-helix (wHTH) protein/tetratricopeptide (TPR) repeat protein